MELISQGAEAKIFLTDQNKDKSDDKKLTIIKERTAKGYRHPILDDKIRNARSRKEAKIIDNLKEAKIKGPALVKVDKKTASIEMSYIEGEKLSEIKDKKLLELMEPLGMIIGRLHNHNIIHGDLTTSNMILGSEETTGADREKDIFLIDFGLSFISRKEEDKAVDLHLLKQALNSKHYRIGAEAFLRFRKSYETTKKDSFNTFDRLKKVEARGRYKKKINK